MKERQKERESERERARERERERERRVGTKVVKNDKQRHREEGTHHNFISNHTVQTPKSSSM